MTDCANDDCAREFQFISETFHEFEKNWIANENVAQALKDFAKSRAEVHKLLLQPLPGKGQLSLIAFCEKAYMTGNNGVLPVSN